MAENKIGKLSSSKDPLRPRLGEKVRLRMTFPVKSWSIKVVNCPLRNRERHRGGETKK